MPSKNPHHIAVGILARRDNSVREIKQKLQRKGIAQSDIEETVSWLQEKKLLDESGFAQKRAESIFRTKMVGPSYIRIKLKSAGISEDIIGQALDSLADDSMWQERAKKAIAQWKKAHPKHADDKIRHMRFLASRGFDYYKD